MKAGITWLSDVCSGLRTIARQPRFALFVSMTLAVAIGAGTVIFSFINGLVLQPLPIGQPDRVVLIYSANAR